ncbi:hypothetical protein K0M31_000397 [Melipona bicolor]|uniref:Uncharacterized protein n=1 Tax=Melipona bicolor TaxID=60889 RepID=A0AA40GDP4_9HYME|nr:hypothetical protein K0M31_000397 [Melipona bicolor]
MPAIVPDNAIPVVRDGRASSPHADTTVNLFTSYFDVGRHGVEPVADSGRRIPHGPAIDRDLTVLLEKLLRDAWADSSCCLRGIQCSSPFRVSQPNRGKPGNPLKGDISLKSSMEEIFENDFRNDDG